MDVKGWSSTAASNNSNPPDGWPEGQAANTVNDCAREMMAALRRQFEDAQWFSYGDTPTRVDGDTFTVPTDLTALYEVGRRLKCTGSATGYCTVASSSYSAPNTTVNVTMDTGSLPATLSAVYLSILTATNSALPSIVGSFTASLTGTSGPTTGTLHWEKTGNQVSLWAAADILGTGNAVNFIITGLPAAITPTTGSNSYVPAGVVYDGVAIKFALAQVNTNNTIQFGAAYDATGYIGVNNIGWTSSGTKGLPVGWRMNYSLF